MFDCVCVVFCLYVLNDAFLIYCVVGVLFVRASFSFSLLRVIGMCCC